MSSLQKTEDTKTGDHRSLFLKFVGKSSVGMKIEAHHPGSQIRATWSTKPPRRVPRRPVRARRGTLLFDPWLVDVASPGKRPDLLAYSKQEAHLIEIKAKLTSRDSDELVPVGPLVYLQRSTGFSNRLEGILRKAASQLSFQPDCDIHPFRIVWFFASGRDYHWVGRQFIASLYGSRRVGFYWPSGHLSHLPCYYARNSAFFRFRESLDGAVYWDQRGGIPCLNDLADRYQSLKGSLLTGHFENGVLDPAAEEAKGHAFRVVGEVPRDNDGALIEYLSATYDIKTVDLFDLEHHQAELVIRERSE